MAFKLGKEKRGFNIPEKTPMRQETLESGTLGQANNDGSIDIDSSVNPNSIDGIGVIVHEQTHQEQMQSGRSDYGDNWVLWEDKIYIRKTIEGEDIIDGPNGRWPEGHPNHPWEAEAVQAEEAIKSKLTEQAAKEAVREKIARKMIGGKIRENTARKMVKEKLAKRAVETKLQREGLAKKAVETKLEESKEK